MKCFVSIDKIIMLSRKTMLRNNLLTSRDLSAQISNCLITEQYYVSSYDKYLKLPNNDSHFHVL